MFSTVKRLAVAAAVLAGGLFAVPALASKAAGPPGSLVVVDPAKAFTEDGINKAKEAFASVRFDRQVNVTVETFPEIPADKKAAFDAATDKHKFYHDWARDTAKAHNDKGLYVLIVMKPGHVEVLADRETGVGRDFSKADSDELAKKLVAGFTAGKGKPDAEAKAAHDKGLLDGTNFVIAQLKGTHVGTDAGTVAKGGAKPSGGEGGFWSKYGGLICVGIVGLLAVWLIIGVIRAMSGGGAGGGGMGGGGGGGFMTSMLGGLFGAAAGMWLYSHFMGGGSMFGGSDSYGGDAGTGGDAGDAGGGDTGAGDYDGGTSGGGDFDGGGGGDFGGGDF